MNFFFAWTFLSLHDIRKKVNCAYNQKSDQVKLFRDFQEYLDLLGWNSYQGGVLVLYQKEDPTTVLFYDLVSGLVKIKNIFIPKSENKEHKVRLLQYDNHWIELG